MLLTSRFSEDAQYSQVYTAASAVVNILRQHGFSCAIVGGFACKLYGSPRYPNVGTAFSLLDEWAHGNGWYLV